MSPGIHRGRVTTYTYDAMYQRTHIQYDDGSEVHFTYDAEGNKLSVVTDSSQIYHSYDTRSRLIEKTHLIDGSEYSFTFNYDDSGHLISMEYPDNTVIDQTYDDLGRLTDVGTYAHYEFTIDSLIETQSYGNGVITSYTYDVCHRPLSIDAHKNQNLLSLAYTYDPTGNITQLEKEWIDPATQTQHMTAHSFSYDALDRLIQATGGGDSLSFSYDPVGNRVQHTYNGSTTSYTYLAHDQLESAGEWNFTYDAYGNQIAKTSLSEEWTYDFDTHDRLTAVTHDGQTIGTYSYNGADQRIKKTEWNEHSQQFETVIYAHAFGRVYYEKNITNNTETLYIYGLTGRIAKKCGEELMYYHTDRLGTTHLLTDSSGTPITAVEYEPFGDADLSGEQERYLYTGQEIDTSGLYYYKARYYDVETGRFLSRDRWVGDHRRPQTLNKYVYCVNNPLKYSDPTGNSFSFADDIIASTITEPDDFQDSETPDPTEFAKMLSEIVTLKIIANCDPNGLNTSRNAMEEAMQIFENPEDQKEFEEAWKDTFSKTCLEYVSPAAAEERLDKALLELEGDLTCLMEHTSEELWSVAGGLIGTPFEQVEMLRKVAYIAKEYYNIAIKDEYKGPPLNLDELCGKDESEGMCTGSILLSIFLMLSLFLIPCKKEDIR